MSDVNIPKQCVVPVVGSVVLLREHYQSMIVTEVFMDNDHKPFAACVVWLDDSNRPCHSTYPLACLEPKY
jgi:hypothetical protein